MRRPEITASFEDGLIVDSFAGGGGASTGLEEALGRHVDIAINHSPEAIAMHRANHPNTRHFCENVWALAPLDVTGGRPVALMWASPDCFPAGTMVLTRSGYRSIEEIQVGDEVLTHERRWRRVTATMSTVRPLLRLSGRGHPGLLVSSEHPFLARKRACLHQGWKLGEPGWTKAGELERGWYWGSPCSFPGDVPPAVPVYRGRSLAITPALMWLAGRYIADGWTRLTDDRAELVLTCGESKIESLRAHLSEWPRAGGRSTAEEIAWSERDTTTAHQFSTSHRGLVEWLREQFGHGAEAKRIPGWALGMAGELRAALLDGYLSGDGYTANGTGNPVIEATTVSKALAFGLKALAMTLGHSPCVYLSERQTHQIEGRDVTTHPAWRIKWRLVVDLGHRQTVREDGIEWAPVRERADASESAQVFNLSVEEDESYVAEGIIVHNCTHFSRAKGAAKRSDGRRGLAWVVVRWAHDVRPRVILLENVAEFQTWGPLVDGQPDPKREGETFREWTGQLRALGYELEFRELVAADYGAPTTRKRLFMVARCDGQEIRWPERTHGDGCAHPWRTAAEIIDWSLPCPSIFDRARPLAEATQRRIAEGLRRYVLSGEPFIAPGGYAPTLIQTGYGERPGQAPRALDLARPLGTVVAGGAKHALVAAFLAKHYGGVVGHQVTRPLGTITTQDHHSLVEATLEPRRDHSEQVRAFLLKWYGTATGQAVSEPLHTVTTKARFGLVEVRGEQYAVTDIGMRMLVPRELFNAQAFPRTYQIERDADGREIPKTTQIALCGNSVSPVAAAALVRANTRSAQAVAA